MVHRLELQKLRNDCLIHSIESIVTSAPVRVVAFSAANAWKNRIFPQIDDGAFTCYSTVENRAENGLAYAVRCTAHRTAVLDIGG